MLEQLKIEIQKHANPETHYTVLREQLQLLIPEILTKRGYFRDFQRVYGETVVRAKLSEDNIFIFA